MLYKEAVYERMPVEMHRVKLNIEVSPLPRGAQRYKTVSLFGTGCR